MLPKKIYLNYVDEADEDKTWSEEPVSVYDCKMQNREYTDLSQVWHDASEEPKDHSKIVIVDTEGEWWNIDYDSDVIDGCSLYSWKFCIAEFNLKIWAYTDDLLPKGGEK